MFEITLKLNTQTLFGPRQKKTKNVIKFAVVRESWSQSITIVILVYNSHQHNYNRTRCTVHSDDIIVALIVRTKTKNEKEIFTVRLRSVRCVVYI